MTETTARKNDKGKLRMRLEPIHARIEVAKVLNFGAEKYEEGNWGRGAGFASGRLLDAAERHITAYECGIDADEETGLHPLAHAICELMFLLDQEMRGMDDQRGDRQPLRGDLNYHDILSNFPHYTKPEESKS